MAQVLGLSPREAGELLQKGDLSFIFRSDLPQDFPRAVSRLKELNRIHPAASFYAGLQAEAYAETYKDDGGADAPAKPANGPFPSGKNLEFLLFCAALDSTSLPASREAALKLLPLVLENTEEVQKIPEINIKDLLTYLNMDPKKWKTYTHLTTLRAACLYRLGSYNEAAALLSGKQEEASPLSNGGWEKALALFAAWKARAGEAGSGETESAGKLKEETGSFLFGTVPEEARHWVYGEALSSGGMLSPVELTALSCRFFPESYAKTLADLRPALADGGILFFRYPELLADLGKAYQYSPALREEGAELFVSWQKLLESPEEAFTLPASFTGTNDYPQLGNFLNTLDKEALNERSYTLLYYAGRIERARGDYKNSSDYFTRAREFAPDALQSDACIWYVLMNTLTKTPAGAAAAVLQSMPQWNDASYFSDILDRLACYLTAGRQWTRLLEIYNALERLEAEGRSHTGVSLSQYAWILGRAAEEGYLQAGGPTGAGSAEHYFQTAFEAGNGSFYYRAMAAAKLGKTFAPEKDNPAPPAAPVKEQEDDLDFILGFFDYGAASYALPFIKTREKGLDTAALRKIAEALASSLRWKESLDLVSRYMEREDYLLSRQDLYLFYPRPYRDLIEKYSGEAGMGAELLFALIRTESYFMPEIVSRSGAVGLAQLMAPTADEMAGRIARRGGTDYREPGIELKDPETSIHLGSFYLRYLTEQTGSPMIALLAYNGGVGRLRRWLAADRQQKDGGLPHDLFLETIDFAETREYGRRVLAAAAVYGYLYYGMTMEAVALDIFRQR